MKGTIQGSPRGQNVQEERYLVPEGNSFGNCRMRTKSESALVPSTVDRMDTVPLLSTQRSPHLENAITVITFFPSACKITKERTQGIVSPHRTTRIVNATSESSQTVEEPLVNAVLHAPFLQGDTERGPLVGMSYQTTRSTSQIPGKEPILNVFKRPKRVINLLESLCSRLYRDF